LIERSNQTIQDVLEWTTLKRLIPESNSPFSVGIEIQKGFSQALDLTCGRFLIRSSKKSKSISQYLNISLTGWGSISIFVYKTRKKKKRNKEFFKNYKKKRKNKETLILLM